MKDWSINKRALFLALLPTLVITLTLTAYYNINRITYLEDSLYEKGQLIADKLAPACEYGVFSGDQEVLTSLINKTLTDKNISKITISNAYNEVILSRNNDRPKQKIKTQFISQFITESFVTFESNITTTEVNFDDFDKLFETDITKQPNEVKYIGHVVITLSTLPTRVKQIDSLIKGTLITVIGLILTVILAIKTSRSVVNPIQELTRAVNEIAEGSLSVRVNVESGGEIGSLEQGVNKMASEIQSVREDLETQVDIATARLMKTLDELEIQNIELDIARSDAISASQIKYEFLANMSHEIRTPMNGVIGFSDLLAKTPLSQQQKDYVNTIKISAKNLLTIINDILDFSKIESGKLSLENIHFDLIELIDEVTTIFTQMAYEKNIELIRFPCPEIPILSGDPNRLRQILINLISNAIKFTPSGFVSLKILLTQSHDKHITLKFIVTDTGIGMDKQNQELLFQSFTQADTSISRKFGGTGLGLVISRKLAELMGGDIGFDSKPQRGSVFWCSLPFDTNQVIPLDNTSSSNGKILLVDTLDQTRMALRQYLSICHYDTIETSRSERLAALINENPDATAIIISINRSHIDNLFYINNLANLTCVLDIPVLIVASAIDDAELRRLNKAGLSPVIYKNQSQTRLICSLKQFLESGSINTELEQTADINQSPASRHDYSDISVLVVDDNEINLKLADNILTSKQIKVSLANNGAQAIEMAQKQHFDIIFMDLHMPKKDGFAAAEHIRNTDNYCRHSYIVALTANALPQEQQHAYDCGINDMLIKPINESMLLDILFRYSSSDFRKTALPSDDSDTETEPGETVFDKQESVRLAGGNEQLAMELFEMLKNELPNYATQLQAAFSDNDMVQLKNVIHKLHGATSYCGVPALRSASRQLENAVDQQLAEAITELVERCGNCIDAIIQL